MARAWPWLVILVCWLTPADAVVGGSPASPPEPDAAVVFVQRFGRSARLEGIKDDKLGYYSFFGIRYAEPPLGIRRFQRPFRRYLAGEQNATRQCLPCPQRDPYVPGRVIGHEDCLCLNVYAPKMPGEERGCPVVFFIHGGNYRSGSTNSYGGQHLAQEDTILVTAQYRLGSLGYLSTGQIDAAGNVGLFDLHAVMEWIKDYIQFFGGDPTRLVVMGQGSGGSAASLMAMSGEGRAATGVAALSGAPLSPGAVRPDPVKHADSLADRTGCPQKPAERLLMCLRKLPAEEIVLADEDLDMGGMDTMQFLNEIAGRSGAGARVEGEEDLRGLPPIVSEKPSDTLSRREKRVPLLTGVTSAETSRAVFGKYARFLTEQLTAVKDFIKKDVLGGLQDVVQGVDGLLPLTAGIQAILPLPDYYQAVFDTTFNAVDGLGQIAEATGDALFNFPAFQSVRAWGKGGPAYLYSFEHLGNLSKGYHFIPGLALTDNSSDINDKLKGPAHGDELAYIFEPLGQDGQPLGEEVSSTDARVRKSFVGLISKFAHNLDTDKDKGNDTKKDANLLGISPLSSGDDKGDDKFIKIADGISTGKKFRYCQMGIWGNMGERLTSGICKNLIGNLLGNLPMKLPVDNLPVDNLPVTNLPIIPNLFGGNGGKTTQAPRVQQVRRTTRKSPGNLLPFDF